ncbi:hypothetical protein [Moorena producens]|uniref:hypothetical protein n=1 Tax=Moorena producens TaxID=1155739 RepID=UPI003C731833
MSDCIFPEPIGIKALYSKLFGADLLARLMDDNSYVRRRAAQALGRLGKTSNHILPTVIEWIEQHQDSNYVGSGIDALWDLVVGRE